MRNIICTIFLLLISFSLVYGQEGEVKVKVITSQGAEIGVDGDVSSNNIMTKSLTIGEHTVTVYYGASYKKEFALNVTQESEQEYTYLIDGTLSVQGYPEGSTVYVNGLQRGALPCQINALGDLNIRVANNPDYYFDYNQRITISPLSSEMISVSLDRVPPPTNHLILLTWKPQGYGLFYGIGKTFGGYIRTANSFSNSSASEDDSTPYLNNTLSMEYTKESSGYFITSAGFMGTIKRNIFYYGGIGYGVYSTKYVAKKPTDVYSDSCYNKTICSSTSGFTLDCGVAYSYKALAISVGYSIILDGARPEIMSSPYQEIYVGLGVRLQRKHNRR